MNRAEDLFRRIQRDGATVIRAMVDSRESEDTSLDFKDAQKANIDEVKRLFSEAVSGFGNTAGGLIVWGVTTKKAGDSEVANGTNLIDGETLKRLCSTLDNEISKATFPANPGVQNLRVPMDDAGAGVLVTFVPLSPERPLQRQNARRNFMMRAGGAFIELPYQVLAGMFGRAPNPEVRARVHVIANYSLLPGMSTNFRLTRGVPYFQVQVFFDLENIGNVAASNAYLTVAVQSGQGEIAFGEDKSGVWSYRQYKRWAHSQRAVAMAHNDFILAPREASQALGVSVTFGRRNDHPTYDAWPLVVRQNSFHGKA
jgi:hypothetical protein